MQEAQPTENENWTRRSVFVVLICLAVYVFDVYELSSYGVALPGIIQEFNISRLQAGALSTITLWVYRIGAILLLPLADLYGRRILLALSVLGYSLITGLSGLAPTWLTFGIAASATRFPISVGGQLSSVMATESAPTKGRALAQGVWAAGYPIGYVLVALASVALLPTLGWRYMYFLGIVPAILVVFVLRFIPESRHFEKVKSDRAAQGKRHNIFLGFWQVMRRYPSESAKATFVILAYGFWGGFGTWVPLYLNTEKGLGPTTTGIWLAIWWFVAAFSTAGAGWIAQRFGRKWPNIAFVIPAGILMATFGLWTDPTIIFIVGLLLASLFLMPFGQGAWGWTQEIFPTEVRATAFAATGFVGGVLSSFYSLIPGFTPTVGASFPIFGIGYLTLAIAFFIMKETVHTELIQEVGERAGDGQVTEPAAVASKAVSA
jgi:AAHS family cis,cis-muconate transporter-like MFS transporter